MSPRAIQDADWNRGACLVRGLGHCGACHTPRGLAFQEKALDESGAVYLSRGAARRRGRSGTCAATRALELGSWSKDDLVDFLKYGHNGGGAAFGSMIDVVNDSTPYLSDGDIAAIATYAGSPPATSTQAARCL